MTKCPYCKSTKIQKRGTWPKQRYQCRDPKHPEGVSRWFYGETSPANILVFDIETLPGKKYFWRLGDQDWNTDSIIQDWCLLSYSAKWLFQPKSMSSILTPKEARAHDDKRISREIHDLFTQADIIIAHNGKNFDIRKTNTRFLIHDMAPPSPYQVVDTKVAAKEVFNMTSYKLDEVAKALGVGRKIHTEFDLWVGCDNGDKDSLDQMLTYNRQDVFILEDVYVKLRPWIKHPNMSLYVTMKKGEHRCPKCALDDIDWGEIYRTQVSVFSAFRCNHCGAIGRKHESDIVTPSRGV